MYQNGILTFGLHSHGPGDLRPPKLATIGEMAILGVKTCHFKPFLQLWPILEASDLRDNVNGGQMLVSHFDTYMNGSQTPKSLTPTQPAHGTLIHPQ